MSATATVPARYALIGHPVAHSLSPQIHARFAAQTQQALRYEAIDSPVDAFAATLEQQRARHLRGCNVTLPFKEQAFALAQRHSAASALAQAANTLYWDSDGLLCAHNTDGEGLVRDICHNAGFALAGARILVLGAGGAAAGALGSLLAQRPALLCVANRSAHKAQALVQRHAAHAHGARLQAIALQDLEPGAQAPAAFDCIINATSASLGGVALRLGAHCLAPAGALVYDMMYGAAAQAFLQSAARLGAAQCRDGLGMLVEQAALSFALWRGLAPETACVLRDVRAQLHAKTPCAPAPAP